ncbi:DUF2157 domain-containing protein [Lichenicola cladoniae]|uniref:DUF2157 domain-containing protein n=1 Tax=Lichenicola cladoniae TaxID=1484109 RepID=A0A6M8HFL7_9PROT|nr:DUF2157 domain-containing protein [Lichenicola cladoniae]NPD65165.1 DUF2157 domain-containing protein [Acetobacteraceae bacterium]QKE88767.1 DUF2157 domain-containing protein [Lichenicola cladoniae]
MFANRSLDRWHKAGLLDDAARLRIQAWEADHARPVWLLGLAGIGVFTVALGVLALVAANWMAIPGAAKIAVHFALDGIVAASLFAAWREDWHKARELLALLLFGLVLSGIGLVGQVYQLGGTAWQAMLAWMVVCTPFMLLVTRSGLLAVAWQLGAVATYAVALSDLYASIAGNPIMALTWLPAITLLAFGLGRGLMPNGRVQGLWMEGAAILGLLGAASLPQVVLRLDDGTRGLMLWLDWGLAATVALVLMAALMRRRHPDRGMTSAFLATAGWISWAATIWAWDSLHAVARTARGTDDAAQLGVALVFIAFWGVVSWLALRSGRRSLFAGAVTIIALRIFLFYWEAFGSLLSTGLGLVMGGLVCIVLAALGWQIIRRMALLPVVRKATRQ